MHVCTYSHLRLKPTIRAHTTKLYRVRVGLACLAIFASSDCTTQLYTTNKVGHLSIAWIVPCLREYHFVGSNSYIIHFQLSLMHIKSCKYDFGTRQKQNKRDHLNTFRQSRLRYSKITPYGLLFLHFPYD